MSDDTFLIEIPATRQELLTREWVADHVLRHVGSWQGCMICVAFKWGISLDAVDVTTPSLSLIAQNVRERGVPDYE
jgi:hypothetical protein